MLRDIFHDRLFQQVDCHIHSIAQHTVRIVRLFKSILQTRYQQRQSLLQRRRPLLRHIFQPIFQSEAQISGFVVIIISGSGKDTRELLPIRIAALFRLLCVRFCRMVILSLSAHRIPQRRHMLAPPAIRTIAAPVLNVQITIQLQPYRIVFRTAHLRPITPGGSFWTSRTLPC